MTKREAAAPATEALNEDVLMLALDWAGVSDSDLIAKNAAAEYRRLIALASPEPTPATEATIYNRLESIIHEAEAVINLVYENDLKAARAALASPEEES